MLNLMRCIVSSGILLCASVVAPPAAAQNQVFVDCLNGGPMAPLACKKAYLYGWLVPQILREINRVDPDLLRPVCDPRVCDPPDFEWDADGVVNIRPLDQVEVPWCDPRFCDPPRLGDFLPKLPVEAMDGAAESLRKALTLTIEQLDAVHSERADLDLKPGDIARPNDFNRLGGAGLQPGWNPLSGG